MQLSFAAPAFHLSKVGSSNVHQAFISACSHIKLSGIIRVETWKGRKNGDVLTEAVARRGFGLGMNVLDMSQAIGLQRSALPTLTGSGSPGFEVFYIKSYWILLTGGVGD